LINQKILLKTQISGEVQFYEVRSCPVNQSKKSSKFPNLFVDIFQINLIICANKVAIYSLVLTALSISI